MSDDTHRVIASLEEMEPLRQPVLREAIECLHLAPGSRGLDLGCGIGLQALLLAEATVPGGLVTGFDISERLLEVARQKVSGTPFVECITFKQGDMRSLPFEDESFDWVWSADCAGYPAGDLLPVLKEIARVLHPGGKAALLARSAQQPVTQW
jgi:ubiquinone/menaquinone biosynthesis C-methylase UbiE